MTIDNDKVLAQVQKLAEPYIESLGLTLWGAEISTGESRPLVRLFLEGPEGVDVEQCASVSRQLGLALEVGEVIPWAYTLEVSSPGIERRFFKLSQLAPYVGEVLDIKLSVRRGDRKRFKGVLAEVTGDDFELDVEGQPQRFPWDEVAKSRLVYVFPDPQANKTQRKK